jgi:glycosyltransferase involved in cell wall biosynthesis
MPSKQIVFFFNQLNLPHIHTGGEIRGKEIYCRFSGNDKFNATAITPQIAVQNFNSTTVCVGKTVFEKILNPASHLALAILYILRTIESIPIALRLKKSILYNTGDFFCNTIPSLINKVVYPKNTWIVVIHHINDSPFSRKSNYFLSSLFSYLFQRFSFSLIRYRANAIIVVNEQVKQRLLRFGFQMPIFVVGNGLNVQEVKKNLTSLGKVTPKDQIVYFGRLSPTKGSLDLAPIFSRFIKKHPRYELHLIGETDLNMKTRLISLFSKYHCLDQVKFQNFVHEKKEVYRLILQSKVAIFPSYEEGWGISLFEAVMCQRPVVAYRLPIFIKTFGSAIHLVPIGNKTAFSQNISSIIDNYLSNKHQDMVKRAHRIACNYDWEDVFQKEKKIIDNLL